MDLTRRRGEAEKNKNGVKTCEREAWVLTVAGRWASERMPHSFGLLDGGQEFGFRDAAVEALHGLAGTVVDQGHRKRIQFILLHDVVGAHGYGVIDGVLLEEARHFGGGIFVHRDADEGDALR